MAEQEMAALVRGWVYQAAEKIRASFNQELSVASKSSPKDLVTNMDRETEAFFRQQIQTHFPEDRVLGEEGMGRQVEDLEGAVWIIDPIDGTLNFVLQQNFFAIMLARYVDGQPQFGVIYNVMADEYFECLAGLGIRRNGQAFRLKQADMALSECLVASNVHIAINNIYCMKDLVDEAMGLRCYGSAGLEILGVLKGELGMYVSPHLKPWDLAAGNVMAQEAGLVFCQVDGSPLNFLESNAAIIAYPSVYRRFQDYYQASLKG